MELLADYIDLQGVNEIDIFFRGTKKKTAGMKYSETLKFAYDILNEQILTYMDTEVLPKIEACNTVRDLEKVEATALPIPIREKILEFVEKQKHLNIIEKGFIFLDMIRSTHKTIVDATRRLMMGKAQQLELAPKLVDLHGKSI